MAVKKKVKSTTSGNEKVSKKKKTSSKTKSSGDIYSNFGKTNTEKMKKKKKELETRGKVPQLKFAANTTTEIRIMPPHKGVDEFYLDTSLHWSMGTDGKTVRTCRKVYKQECKFCDMNKRLYTAVNGALKNNLIKEKQAEAFKARISSVSSSRRILCYAIDVNDLERGVQQVALPVGVLVDLIDAINDDFGGEDLISDPINGYTIKIKRRGSKMNDTKYRMDIGKKYKVPVVYLEQLKDYPELKIENEEVNLIEDEKLVKETLATFKDILVLEKKVKGKRGKAEDEELEDEELEDEELEDDDEDDSDDDDEELEDDDEEETEDDEEETEDDEEETEDDEEDEDDSDDDEEELEDDDDDDDEDDSDDDDEELEDDDDEDDLDDDDDEDDLDDDDEEDDLEEELKSKKKLKRRKK